MLIIFCYLKEISFFLCKLIYFLIYKIKSENDSMKQINKKMILAKNSLHIL